jgi:type I restriction-modification system DNA methylase subunit
MPGEPQALLRESLHNISKAVQETPGINEAELYDAFRRYGFFESLGYEKFGKDIRAQQVVIGNRKRADYVCRDDYQNVIFVLEAKKPAEGDLESALPQLWERYVLPLKAGLGVLTDGNRIIVYSRIGLNSRAILSRDTAGISDSDADLLYNSLKKPFYSLTELSRLQEYFKTVSKLSLSEDLAKEEFFETFKLQRESVFGFLVISLLNLFDYTYNLSDFLKGAYEFWRKSLAHKPDKMPETWQAFLKLFPDSDESIFKLMFCLETAHALLARLILAKACEDLEFPGISISKHILERTEHFRGRIPMVAYPKTLGDLLVNMRDQLIYSVFEGDIFSWWQDASSSLQNKSAAELLSETVHDSIASFSEFVANLLLVLYKYDFSKVAGDPLGDLYQQYFDRDTRKALGEFYTPTEVVDYILDSVGYSGSSITRKRLLDPACGSGTFLVEALKRYLREAAPKAKDVGWAEILKDLCNSPRIVGLDIHPFACLISQVRFMLELIPFYKLALEQERAIQYTLSRVPVFRTDSLAIEIVGTEFDKHPTLVVTEEDIKFTLSLPIRVGAEESLLVDVTIPSWAKTAKALSNELYNLDEYFCASLAMFDSVKERLRAGVTTVDKMVLSAFLRHYLNSKDFEKIADFYKSYADTMMGQAGRIREKFGDGRLIKSVEDAVLAALLKNYLHYDFVVGNPPYVRTQLFVKNKPYIRSTYKETAKGNFDIFIPFIQRGIMFLSTRGKIGFITSVMFTNRDYGTGVRRYILDNCTIEQIVNFGGAQVFEGVTNYACIFVLANGHPKGPSMIKCVRFTSYEDDRTGDNGLGLRSISPLLSETKKQISNDFVDIFEIDQQSLNSGPWLLVPREEHDVFDKIAKASDGRLVQLCDPVLGIKEATRTGADKIFLVDQNTVSKYSLEKELLRPKIKGAGEIKRWVVQWDGKFILFPYTLKEGKFSPINIEDFPNAYKYLLPHKEKLEKRRLFTKTILEHKKKWYELWNPLPYNRLKILYPEIAPTNRFALDDKGLYPVGKNFIIYLNTQENEDYLYFLGLLNSKVLEFWFKHIAPVKRNFYYEYMGNVEQIPIRWNPPRELRNDVVRLVKSILVQADLAERVASFPDSYLQDFQSAPIELDERRFQLKSAHSKVKPDMTPALDKRFAVYPAPGEQPLLETEQRARYLVLALKNAVPVEQTIHIMIPRDDDVVSELLRKFDSDERDASEPSVLQLEDELNKVVHRIYEVLKEDDSLIDLFLTRFSSRPN